MHRRDEAKAAQTNKEESSERSILTSREPVKHGDNDGPNTKYRNDAEVNNFGSKLAVEPIVDPGDKTTNCKEANTNIIKLAEELGYLFGVTADCMKEAGQTQAEDSTEEEEEEDKFLSELDIRVALITERLHIENDCHGDESHKSYQMCPDVSSLRVNTED